MITFNDDPRLINIASSRKKAEKDYDDIVWDHGVHDPRLADLANQIEEWRQLEEQGETVQPTF